MNQMVLSLGESGFVWVSPHPASYYYHRRHRLSSSEGEKKLAERMFCHLPSRGKFAGTFPETFPEECFKMLVQRLETENHKHCTCPFPLIPLTFRGYRDIKNCHVILSELGTTWSLYFFFFTCGESPVCLLGLRAQSLNNAALFQDLPTALRAIQHPSSIVLHGATVCVTNGTFTLI